MPIAQEISDMLDIGWKPSQVISVVFFTLKIAKIAQWVDPFRMIYSPILKKVGGRGSGGGGGID